MNAEVEEYINHRIDSGQVKLEEYIDHRIDLARARLGLSGQGGDAGIIEGKQAATIKADDKAVPANLLLFCFIYLVLIAGAEAVTAFADPLWGFICYLVCLLALIVNAAIAGTHDTRRLFLALSLVPLIRITIMVLPLGQFSDIYNYFVISIPVIIGILAVVYTMELKLHEIGITTKSWYFDIIVAATGFGIGAAEYLILRPESLITRLTIGEVLVPALILLFATGFVEELAFRGVIQRALQRVVNLGWIYVAVLYTTLQIGRIALLDCDMDLLLLHFNVVFGISLFYGWIVHKTGSIIGVSLSHGIANICFYLVYHLEYYR